MSYKINKKLTIILLTVGTIASTTAILIAKNEALIAKDERYERDILIIFSTGNQNTIKSEIIRNNNKIDIVSSATPKEWNCKNIAEEMAAILRGKNLTVEIIEAKALSNTNMILSSRVIILGSPAHFWNVSWEIKRICDVYFYEIYKRSGKLNKKRIGAYAMAEIEPSAQDVLNAIQKVVGDCNGQFGPTMSLLTEYSEQEIRRRLDKFTNKIISSMK